MKYDKYDRQAIKQLSGSSRALFDIIEEEEKGEIVEIPRLCSALKAGPKFVLFSCLAGDGQKEELGMDLGTLFTTRLGQRVKNFLKSLHQAGYQDEKGFGLLSVIIDDTEPVEVWGWEMPQGQVTDWYRMVIDDGCNPFGCEVMLWSTVKKMAFPFPGMDRRHSLFRTFVGVCDEVEQVKSNSLLLYQLFDHMKKFPNKKLKKNIDLRDAALRRLAHYETQGFVLHQAVPNAVLIQTETPWSVKDPLYHPRENSLPIIHPFSENRK